MHNFQLTGTVKQTFFCLKLLQLEMIYYVSLSYTSIIFVFIQSYVSSTLVFISEIVFFYL